MYKFSSNVCFILKIFSCFGLLQKLLGGVGLTQHLRCPQNLGPIMNCATFFAGLRMSFHHQKKKDCRGV